MYFSALARSVSQHFTGKKKPKSKSPTNSNTRKSQATLSNCSSVGACSIKAACSDDEDEKNSDRLNTAAEQLNKQRQPYQQIVQQILHQVSELEHTLYEDQQEEFKLRLTLERQTEKINELNFSLNAERQRNTRLVLLLKNSDNCSISDESEMPDDHMKSTGNIYDSISPLLMQHRYEELAISHRQSRRQLAKKERAYKSLQCRNEELKGNYDRLFDEYRKNQRRLEGVCTRYLQTLYKKKHQISNLRNSLSNACECIFYAQEMLDIHNRHHKKLTDEHSVHLKKYNQNFESFMISLRNCCCQRRVQEMQQKRKDNPVPKEPSMVSSDATLVPRDQDLKSK